MVTAGRKDLLTARTFQAMKEHFSEAWVGSSVAGEKYSPVCTISNGITDDSDVRGPVTIRLPRTSI